MSFIMRETHVNFKTLQIYFSGIIIDHENEGTN